MKGTSSKKRPTAKVMACSMTGYGFGKSTVDRITVEVEIRSVNHRFLDLNFRLPRQYGIFEGKLKEIVGKRVERGHLDLYVSRTALQSSGRLKVDKDLFRSLFKTYLEVARTEAGISGRDRKLWEDLKVSVMLEVMRRSEVLGLQDKIDDEETEADVLEEALKKALDGVCKSRALEGARLVSDVSARISHLLSLCTVIHASVENAPSSLKMKLVERIAKLSPEIKVSEEKLAQEVALLADRVDVTEELVRLRSHFQSLKDSLCEPGTGRKLDFLVQEVGREFNTIGSKAQDSKVQGYVIEAKQELEKIREQVQNIE
jgi:uncharacterized protein (TIGR00255 family)